MLELAPVFPVLLRHRPEGMGAGQWSVRLPSWAGEGMTTGVLSSRELEPREGTFFPSGQLSISSPP